MKLGILTAEETRLLRCTIARLQETRARLQATLRSLSSIFPKGKTNDSR